VESFRVGDRKLKGLKRGKLRVALVTTAKYFLPRMLGAFCRRFPDIDIELEIGNREKIVERLRNKVLPLPAQSFLDELLQTGFSGLSQSPQ